jgi:hypothetical protein
VLVVVVLAFVGILASVALWLSFANFQMKITDKNVTDSFYSAEGVLDQVCVGLQNDISESLGAAYLNVMQQYSGLSVEERENEFTTSYVSQLRSRLKYTTSVTGLDGNTVEADALCSLSKLKTYISTSVRSQVVLSNADDNSKDYCFVKTVSDGLQIADLVVEYTDETGNLSIIQTDILLQIPDMNLISSEGVPQVFDYSIIGNAGVEIKGPGTKISGSVYAGSKYALNNKSTSHDASVSDDEYYRSLVVANTANVDFSGANYVIADGDLLVSNQTGKAASATIVSNSNGELWARNIEIMDGAKAVLSGATNVSDDLTISGTGSEVKIGGSYLGYGDSTTGDDGSSAVIINGKDSVLDMSAADSIVVSGYAYINTSAISADKNGTVTNDTGITDNSNIQLGESIMVKGDQIAYLVPAECVGLYMKNPLTVAEYKTLVSDSRYPVVDETVITKTDKPLSSYFADGQTVDQAYQMVLVPSKTGNSDDGLVYLYLNLEAEQASAYFLDYYKAGADKLKRYNAFYTNGIQVKGAGTTIYTAGTYAEYVEGADGTSISLNYGQGTDSVSTGNTDPADVYNALTTKLISDPTQLSVQDAGTVFDNVIDKEHLQDFLQYCTGKTYTDTLADVGGIELRLVLTDNENSTYEFSDSDPNHIYIIVATGNVTLNTNFTGTVIANGKVTVGAASNITIKNTDIAYVKKLLAVICTNGNNEDAYLFSFFKAGNIFISSGFGNGGVSVDTSTEIDLSELVSYRNWKKK